MANPRASRPPPTCFPVATNTRVQVPPSTSPDQGKQNSFKNGSSWAGSRPSERSDAAFPRPRSQTVPVSPVSPHGAASALRSARFMELKFRCARTKGERTRPRSSPAPTRPLAATARAEPAPAPPPSSAAAWERRKPWRRVSYPLQQGRRR